MKLCRFIVFFPVLATGVAIAPRHGAHNGARQRWGSSRRFARRRRPSVAGAARRDRVLPAPPGLRPGASAFAELSAATAVAIDPFTRTVASRAHASASLCPAASRQTVQRLTCLAIRQITNICLFIFGPSLAFACRSSFFNYFVS